MKHLIILITILIFGLIGVSQAESKPNQSGPYATSRENMIAVLEAASYGRTPIRDARVLSAMRKVPRHVFVPESRRHMAYADTPLPIGNDQTISQPYIVAHMTQAAAIKPTDRVLEIGTGSGYQAAVLAELAEHVYTIEIIEALGLRARSVLESQHYKNISFKIGDGYKGWPEAAPFDAILVTAAPDHVPQPLLDQLKTGGRLVIPVGPVGRHQKLKLFTKDAQGKLHETLLDDVRFVPLTREKDE